jgi:putative nucleotidyltransferase with HDIG domain
MGRQPRELNFRLLHKNGELRHFQCRGAVIFDALAKPVRFVGMIQDITEPRLAEIQIHQQIERLSALRRIDQAITSNFDLPFTLNTILSEVSKQLQVDAAEILLLNAEDQVLEYAASQGFRIHAAETARVPMGESLAGRVAKERRLIKIEEPLLSILLAGEDFVCYYGLPLIAKGKVRGVLEVFHRTPLHPYPEWLDFLNALAEQTAIAIDDATLFENLQASNLELMKAYDTTIEGWSRALDLRDQETEGHTQRVTEMTLTLARRFGFHEENLLHLRWGTLLHDIGKMGVPDNVLLKPEPLTEEEWIMMRKHPQYAYDLLKPIAFLGSALDIPYSHHEKWDGTGYPRGLKAYEIPFAARLFAVVDVWDALTSDRPYRPAWSEEEALAFIREQSDKHFDPQVVDVFISLLHGDENTKGRE